MRQTKSCACLIGTAARDLEISKRKTTLRIKELNKRLKKVRDPNILANIKSEKRKLNKTLQETSDHKKKVIKRFDEHIKKSGYVPPKYKGV